MFHHKDEYICGVFAWYYNTKCPTWVQVLNVKLLMAYCGHNQEEECCNLNFTKCYEIAALVLYQVHFKWFAVQINSFWLVNLKRHWKHNSNFGFFDYRSWWNFFKKCSKYKSKDTLFDRFFSFVKRLNASNMSSKWVRIRNWANYYVMMDRFFIKIGQS